MPAPMAPPLLIVFEEADVAGVATEIDVAVALMNEDDNAGVTDEFTDVVDA